MKKVNIFFCTKVLFIIKNNLFKTNVVGIIIFKLQKIKWNTNKHGLPIML